MAKKLKINKEIGAINKRNKKKTNTIKDCFINLVRLSQREIDSYTKSNIVVANFNLKISNESIQIGDKTYNTNSQTYNLTFKKNLSELVLNHCEEAPSTQSIASTSQNNPIKCTNGKS